MDDFHDIIHGWLMIMSAIEIRIRMSQTRKVSPSVSFFLIIAIGLKSLSGPCLLEL